MRLDIDLIIFIGFLVANIVFGLLSSRGVRSIDEFAVGDRKFSTATIAATIIATWVSGDFFFVNASETYKSGLLYSFSALGDIVCILLVGIFFAPRMGEFLGKLSVAEAMGSLYGDKVRVISAISGVMGVAGMIAVHLKVAGLTFEYAFGISGLYGILSAGIIITLYSALGGIKSVTFTDVIQFFTFGTVIPTIAYAIFSSLDNTSVVLEMLSTHKLFDYHNIFDLSTHSTLYHISLFFCFAIPAFNPAIFQRIAMASDTVQVRKSFFIAAFTCFMLLMMISWISILIISIDPDIESGDVIKHVILKYSSVGLEGLMLVGVMAMVMSTADSFVNATSVLIVHDFCVPLGIKMIKSELFSARIASLVLGVISIALSLYENNLIELLTLAYSFYMPIVTVPFVMAIIGFRSTEKAVLSGMIAGIVAVFFWDYVLCIKVFNSVPPAMLANLVVLVSSHYLLKQSGGWVGIKDMEPVIALRTERQQRWKRFMKSIKQLSIINLCNKNSPSGEGFISILGFFVMISVFGSTNALLKTQQSEYAYFIDILYLICLCSSTLLISYPLWLQSWKNSKVLGLLWNIIMFFILICYSFFMVLISNFAEIQLMVFLVNIVMLSSIVSWRWALFSIITGVITTVLVHKYYLTIELSGYYVPSQFKIIYLLLLVSSTLLTFLKPREDAYQLAEERVGYLSSSVDFYKREVSGLLDMKSEFLRNIEHESRTPITGVASMAQVLDESYDKIPEDKRREVISEIARSSERLNSWASNLVDLSRLSVENNDLEKSPINISELVEERFEKCKKLHDKGLHQFLLYIDENVIVNCNRYYISVVIDNLIVNALQYCSNGKIEIHLHVKVIKGVELIEFTIMDEGVGIPPEELFDIFGVFTISSKTKNSSGGRGVGLALCKKVINMHDGEIVAESDGKKGATIRFTLPLITLKERK